MEAVEQPQVIEGSVEQFLEDAQGFEGMEEPSGEQPTGGSKGDFPPNLYPGSYRATFRLAPVEGQFGPGIGKVTRQGKEYLSCQYTATVKHAGLAAEHFTREPKFDDTRVSFQDANLYRSPNMKSSRLEDLFFALGGKPAGNHATLAEIVAKLKEADQQGQEFTVDLGWRAAEQTGTDADGKKVYTEVTTYPDKRASAWPKDANGKYELQATMPSGEKKYGQLRVVRVRRIRES